jgi:glycosyltransferase involved in cell wall biosynthesis
MTTTLKKSTVPSWARSRLRLVAPYLGDLATTTPSAEGAYLVAAVLTGRIPDPEEVPALYRLWRTAGVAAMIDKAAGLSRWGRPKRVRITSGIIIDVTDTARSDFTTGIQRVARESVRRWPRSEIELVCWEASAARLHAPSFRELGRFPGLAAPIGEPDPAVCVIPFRATLVLPEIAVARDRYRGLLTIARHSESRSLAIGFDCIPMTSAEYVAPGMAGAFANYLAALSAFDEVVAISSAAAEEFAGWRQMARGSGLEGPEISVADLPFAAERVTPETIAEVRRSLRIDTETPVVLTVGSHEPRKNHLAFLHACELLWRQGAVFTVVMVGGNSWNSEEFDALVGQLQSAGRPLILISRADDATVWSLYRIARFSAFCSFNEGFGLPVAESLSAGTPVISSALGSMRELAEGNGGLLIDPRSVEDIHSAIARLLHDDLELERLREQAASLPMTSWGSYAEQIWARVSRLAKEPAGRV